MEMRSESLSDDLVLDILLRLPVKSLKRFKCVSRSWCSNFEEPNFMRKHYLTNAIRGTNLRTIVKSIPIHDPLVYNPLLIYDESRFVTNFSLLCNQTMRVSETINIASVPFLASQMVDECEGLILLCGNDNSDPIVLLNPATQELRTLPRSVRPPKTDHVYFAALGLGYDCCTSDYKVLHFANYYHDVDGYSSTHQFELYTLSSNSWRVIANSFGCLLSSRFSTYLNGHCHWWQYKGLNLEQTILAFNVSQETAQDMEFPSSSDFHLCCLEQSLELSIFCNCLAVFARSREKMDCFDIWVMKEYGVTESWTKQLVIGPISRVEEQISRVERFGVCELLGMWKTGEWFFETDEFRLALFHPHTKAVKDLEIPHTPKVGIDGLMLFIFTESLFSPNGR